MHELRATAVLLNFRRAGNIYRIIESLAAVPQVRNILIWNNAPALDYNTIILKDTIHRAAANWPPIHVMGGCGNCCCWGRYRALEEFGHGDVALTQDDDYIVQNWGEILASWERRRDRVTAALYPWHLERDKLKRWYGSDGKIIAHETLLGWGSAFDPKLVPEALRGYIAAYGKSQTFLREADRVFAIGLAREHIVIPHKTLALHGECSHESAMYLEPGHQQSVAKARTEALALLGIKYQHIGL